jgi:type IV pilus assembly protein PilM
VKSILNKATSTAKTGPAGGRPPAAVELTVEGAIAAALPLSGREPLYAFAQLPAGALAPGVSEPNIRSVDAVVGAIKSVLDRVQPRSRFVTLVLPDPSVRIFILDFDSLPSKAAEAIAVMRLRMRKMVPFDVENAAISYQVLAQNGGTLKVLTAILPGQMLAEYELAVRAAGYEPGAVLPSSLAALETIDSMESVLTASLDPSTLTTSITNGSDLLLHRTLDLPQEPELWLAEIQRGIAVAAAFFEDTLHAPAREIRYTGSYDAGEFAEWIGDMDLNVVELAPRPETGAMTALGHASIAGTAGALVGAN